MRHPSRKRNRGFEETHDLLLATALRLISEAGEQALSIAALAREAGINRATVYYHFATREDLLAAARAWAAAQLSAAFAGQSSQADRIDRITRFVLDHPQLVQLWIEDFIATGNIRESYPDWDALVSGTRLRLEPAGIDTEVFCTLLITGAVIGPRVFSNAVRPDLDKDEVTARFRREQQRVLGQLGMLIEAGEQQ